MVRRPTELFICAGLTGVALIVLASSYVAVGGINAASTDQPMRLPRILLGIWIVLSTGCALRAAFWAPPATGGERQTAKVVSFIVVLLLTAVALPVLGYAVAVTLGLGGLLWILGERDPLRFAVTLTLLGPGLWAVFHHLLGLRLPLLVSGGAF